MKHTHTLLWVAACLPVIALAQSTGQTQPAPVADPASTVPALRYQSTFTASAPAPAEATPDQGWIAANRAVAGTEGHAHAPATTPAAPAAEAPAKAATASAHQHHHDHGSMKEGK